MRLLALALGLAACSHPAAGPTTPPLQNELDLGPCLPTQIDLIGDQGDTLRLCEEDDELSCYALAATGEVTRSPGDPDAPSFEFDGDQVLSCDAADDCRTLQVPLEPGWVVTDAADVKDGVMAVALQQGDEGDATPGRIEIWDPAGPVRLASADVDGTEGWPRTYLVAFIGSALLVVVDGKIQGQREASLWRLDRDRLTRVADLTGELSDWATVDPSHGVFVIDHVIKILDVGDGREVATAPWRDALAPDAVEQADYLGTLLYLDERTPGTFAFGVDAGGSFVGVGIADVAGHVTRYPVNVCPEGARGD